MNTTPPTDHIDLTDLEQVRYWTRELGITFETLRRVIRAVGPRPGAVRAALDAAGARREPA